MDATATRHGQTEVGTITVNGMEFSVTGSSVRGSSVSAYTKQTGRDTCRLVRWDGQSMMDCRCVLVRELGFSHDSSFVIRFRLPGGRHLVGLAYDLDGMLFQGEVIGPCDEREADRAALCEAEYWLERDRESGEEWEESQCTD